MPSFDCLGRGKMSIAVNLKKKEGAAVIKKLCNGADVLIEPYRVGKFTCIKLCCVICVVSFASKYGNQTVPPVNVYYPHNIIVMLCTVLLFYLLLFPCSYSLQAFKDISYCIG